MRAFLALSTTSRTPEFHYYNRGGSSQDSDVIITGASERNKGMQARKRQVGESKLSPWYKSTFLNMHIHSCFSLYHHTCINIYNRMTILRTASLFRRMSLAITLLPQHLTLLYSHIEKRISVSPTNSTYSLLSTCSISTYVLLVSFFSTSWSF